MAKKRRVPNRMCIACHEMKAKKEMVRIVRNKEGLIDIDLNGKAQGRGAYVCPSEGCYEKVMKKKLLDKTFSTKIDEEIYIDLKNKLEKVREYN